MDRDVGRVLGDGASSLDLKGSADGLLAGFEGLRKASSTDSSEQFIDEGSAVGSGCADVEFSKFFTLAVIPSVIHSSWTLGNWIDCISRL